MFRRFIDGSVTPQACIEAYHLQPTPGFERVAERNRQLTDDANAEIIGRDLREPKSMRYEGQQWPHHPRLMITEAERRFPARIHIGAPPDGLGRQLHDVP